MPWRGIWVFHACCLLRNLSFSHALSAFLPSQIWTRPCCIFSAICPSSISQGHTRSSSYWYCYLSQIRSLLIFILLCLPFLTTDIASPSPPPIFLFPPAFKVVISHHLMLRPTTSHNLFYFHRPFPSVQLQRLLIVFVLTLICIPFIHISSLSLAILAVYLLFAYLSVSFIYLFLYIQALLWALIL